VAVVPLATIRRRDGTCGGRSACCLTCLSRELNRENSVEKKSPSSDRTGGRAAHCV
jgi:hypothetical protein